MHKPKEEKKFVQVVEKEHKAVKPLASPRKVWTGPAPAFKKNMDTALLNTLSIQSGNVLKNFGNSLEKKGFNFQKNKTPNKD